MFFVWVGQFIFDISNYISDKKKKIVYFINFYFELYKSYEKEFDSEYELAFNANNIIKQNKILTWKEIISSFSRRQKTEYYAALQSLWPLFIATFLSTFLIFLVTFFHSENVIKFQTFFLVIAFIAVFISISFWFSVFFLEKIQGNHNFKILDNIEMGFFLFLFTEALCFVALFWIFLHRMLVASLHVGLYNPGEGVTHFYINEEVTLNKNFDVYYYSTVGTPCLCKLSSCHLSLSESERIYNDNIIKAHINFHDKGQLINPYQLPLLNTFILLTSAAVLNLSHLFLKSSNFFKSFFYLLVTIIFGFTFVCIQYKEYKECALQYNDGIYAACFFSLTGLHGFHVIIGLICLSICLINFLFLNYSASYHQSYHYSILYWHFVDVIWLFVYFIIYLWPAAYFFKTEIYSIWLSPGYYSIHFGKDYFEKVIIHKAFELKFKGEELIFIDIFKHLQDLSSNSYNYNELINYKKKSIETFLDSYVLLKPSQTLGASIIDLYTKFLKDKETNYSVDDDLLLLSKTYKLPFTYKKIDGFQPVAVSIRFKDLFQDHIDNNTFDRVFQDEKKLLHDSTLKQLMPFVYYFEKYYLDHNYIRNASKKFSSSFLEKIFDSNKNKKLSFIYVDNANLFYNANYNLELLEKEKIWRFFNSEWYFDESLILTSNLRYLNKTFNINTIVNCEIVKECILFELCKKKNFLNSDLVKRDIHAFCFVMNIMHYEMFNSVEHSLINDIRFNIKKIIFLSFFYFFSKKLLYVYLYFFMPYLFEYKMFQDKVI